MQNNNKKQQQQRHITSLNVPNLNLDHTHFQNAASLILKYQIHYYATKNNIHIF